MLVWGVDRKELKHGASTIKKLTPSDLRWSLRYFSRLRKSLLAPCMATSRANAYGVLLAATCTAWNSRQSNPSHLCFWNFKARRKFHYIIICCPQAYKFQELNIVSAEVCWSMSLIAQHKTQRFFKTFILLVFIRCSYLIIFGNEW